MLGQLAKKIKPPKAKTIVIFILASLIIANIFTCILWGDNELPADASSWLPWFVHSHVSKIEFACVLKEGWKSLSIIQQEKLLEIMRSEFTVLYFNEKDIPPQGWRYDPQDPNIKDGLDKGCILDWRFKRWFLLLQADYADWEGLLAGSNTRVTYIWFFGRWIRLWRSATIVS